MNSRLALFGSLLLFWVVPASAMPLYASREGATCISCHIDPNGGGIRNEFGFNYGKNRHSIEEEEKWAKYTVNPQLNDWIRLGLDARFMYYASHIQDGRTVAPSTFFPMQGNLRVAISPHDQLTIVGSQGIVVDVPGFPAPYVAREIYGLIQGLPKNIYIQAGRFRLPFGLRQEDHTSFLRGFTFLLYDSQSEDAGIEVGSVGPNWFGQFSFTNGGPPFAENAQTVAGKLGRASKTFQAAVSGYHRFSEPFGVTVNRWSVYGSATRGPVTLLGEYGGGTTKSGLGTVNTDAFFGEVDYRVSRGVNLRGKYDWLEPDKESGDNVSRIVGEVDWAPMPFTEIKLSYRAYNDATNYDEYVAMLTMPF